MVYFILGILILLFYLFMTPKSIRGTLNSVTMVVSPFFRYSNYRPSFLSVPF